VGGTQYWVNSQCGAQNGAFIPDGQNPPQAWDGGLLLGTPTGWANGSFADSQASDVCGQAGFNLSDAEVFGISLGVGSNWPDKYTGYADWVKLAFNGGENLGDYAVWSNFELPSPDFHDFPETTVPEPATVALLSCSTDSCFARFAFAILRAPCFLNRIPRPSGQSTAQNLSDPLVDQHDRYQPYLGEIAFYEQVGSYFYP
jgi:hypothetical protein